MGSVAKNTFLTNSLEGNNSENFSLTKTSDSTASAKPPTTYAPIIQRIEKWNKTKIATRPRVRSDPTADAFVAS